MKLHFEELDRNAFEGAAESAPITIEQAKEIVEAGGYNDFPINKWLAKKMIDCAQKEGHDLELVLEYGCPDHRAHCWFCIPD